MFLIVKNTPTYTILFSSFVFVHCICTFASLSSQLMLCFRTWAGNSGSNETSEMLGDLGLLPLYKIFLNRTTTRIGGRTRITSPWQPLLSNEPLSHFTSHIALSKSFNARSSFNARTIMKNVILVCLVKVL